MLSDNTAEHVHGDVNVFAAYWLNSASSFCEAITGLLQSAEVRTLPSDAFTIDPVVSKDSSIVKLL